MKRNNEYSEEILSLKYKIIYIYEYILKHFCKWLLKFDSMIKTIERWIIFPDGKEYYKDYFSCTHSEIKEEIRKLYKEIPNPLLMVIKIYTEKNEEIIFSTDIKYNNKKKNIIYLDDALEKIPQSQKHLFYNKINELKEEDRLFRERKKMERVKKITENQIIEWLTSH